MVQGDHQLFLSMQYWKQCQWNATSTTADSHGAYINSYSMAYLTLRQFKYSLIVQSQQSTRVYSLVRVCSNTNKSMAQWWMSDAREEPVMNENHHLLSYTSRSAMRSLLMKSLAHDSETIINCWNESIFSHPQLCFYLNNNYLFISAVYRRYCHAYCSTYAMPAIDNFHMLMWEQLMQ